MLEAIQKLAPSHPYRQAEIIIKCRKATHPRSQYNDHWTSVRIEPRSCHKGHRKIGKSNGFTLLATMPTGSRLKVRFRIGHALVCDLYCCCYESLVTRKRRWRQQRYFSDKSTPALSVTVFENFWFTYTQEICCLYEGSRTHPGLRLNLDYAVRLVGTNPVHLFYRPAADALQNHTSRIFTTGDQAIFLSR